MGYERHRAIIVSSFDRDLILEAHTRAKKIFNVLVTNIVGGVVNLHQTFMIGPDGSKLGWRESDEYVIKRSAFVDWMETKRYPEDNSTALSYVEVQFADDEKKTKILCSSDDEEKRILISHDIKNERAYQRDKIDSLRTKC